ncbi:hypothetical protein CF326_g8443 [Tilletia indica]|nr:hypothetical protein CF326_g8443 [Tilletia indica]
MLTRWGCTGLELLIRSLLLDPSSQPSFYPPFLLFDSPCPPHTTSQIGESIRKFGISATTTSLLLLRVGTSPTTSQTILDEMRALISSSSSDEERSQELQVADLAREGGLDSYLTQLTSWKDVETVYKIGKDADGLYGHRRAMAGQGDNDAVEQEKEVARHEWADGVVTTIVAMKPVAA